MSTTYYGVNLAVRGGDQMAKALQQLGKKLVQAELRVGFLEGSTYPSDPKRKTKGPLYVATVAFWNEFGTATAPARPFFRQMVSAKSPAWGRSLAKILALNDYDSEKSLSLMGTGIASQLRTSINEWPADNAPRTVAEKKFNKGLVHTAHMLRSVDFQVLLGRDSE